MDYDFLIHRPHGHTKDEFVVEAITIAAGTGPFAAGSVMGKVTASGKYVTVRAGATDGSWNPPYAVILDDGYPGRLTEDVTRLAIVAGPVQLKREALLWQDMSRDQIDMAERYLLASGMLRAPGASAMAHDGNPF
jgi:hypothetical protein